MTLLIFCKHFITFSQAAEGHTYTGTLQGVQVKGGGGGAKVEAWF